MCKPRVNRERAAAALASGLARVRLYDTLRTVPSFPKSLRRQQSTCEQVYKRLQTVYALSIHMISRLHPPISVGGVVMNFMRK